jgi:WD40 repeat protein
MRIKLTLLLLLLSSLLSACAGATVRIPVPEFIVSSTPGAFIPTETATITPTRPPRPTITPSPTFTLVPTRKSPYPVGLATPLPDIGFPPIVAGNMGGLKVVLSMSNQVLRGYALSGDAQKIFLAASNGLFLFDRQGNQLAHWPVIQLFNLDCETCLASNADGSRFAVVVRVRGTWEAQLYAVEGAQAAPVFSKTLSNDLQNVRNEARVALSPDGKWLAFGVTGGPMELLNIETGEKPITYRDAADTAVFSPDGAIFAIRRGRELLTWNTDTWRNPANLLLPEENTPFAFSPGGKFIALALPTRIRIYDAAALKIEREITVYPLTASLRSWTIAFSDEQTLRGFGVEWKTGTLAETTTAEWNIISGETLRRETAETDSPDALLSFWGVNFPKTVSPAGVELGDYHVLRFTSNETLAVNSLHTACWLKPLTGEVTCQSDPENLVFAADALAYREVRGENTTLLQSWQGEPLYEFGPYRVMGLGRRADFALVDVDKITCDLYLAGKKLPAESAPGRFSAFAENSKLIAFSSVEPAGITVITFVNKASGETFIQKRESFALKPLVFDNLHTLYWLKEDRDRREAILKAVDTSTDTTRDLARLPLPAAPEAIAISSNGMIAVGYQDGTLVIFSPDTLGFVQYQSMPGAVTALAFTPDGRYLAAGGADWLLLYAATDW